MQVSAVNKDEYPVLVDLWEASVRTTHDFLSESDIQFYKPLILEQYLDAVELRVARDPSGKILGFIGVASGNIEMLFIAPEHRHQGIGRLLVEHVRVNFAAKKVDVNEQNPQAVAFYKQLGFREVGRSPLDGMGKPFPLLHLTL
ncbi:GNAT family N-acetyltransferase [Marinobacterium sp. CAU 1594]|nr:GNAT family N-acetyltransferase [Marinobacterium arenosum]